MDLQAGAVVHAIRGERAQYRPLKSVLCDNAEPLAVASAFRNKLGLAEIYVADLDAIQGRRPHQETIAALAHQGGMEILLDAGASDVETVQDLLAWGVKKVIVGAETLPSLERLSSLRAAIPGNCLIFSLDMQNGQVLSRCAQLAALGPLAALEHLQEAGWEEVIWLDLARVGTGIGIDDALVSDARRRFPGISLIVGGGIRQASELDGLQTLGVSGVLVATALHQGAITEQHVAALRRAGG